MAMKLDGTALGALSELFANLAQTYTADNPGQARTAAGLQDSAKGIIAAEAAKKEAKRQEKKKPSTLKQLGSIAARAVGSSFGAVGSAAGGALGDTIEGKKVTADSVLSDAIIGGVNTASGMAGAKGLGTTTPKTPAGPAQAAEGRQWRWDKPTLAPAGAGGMNASAMDTQPNIPLPEASATGGVIDKTRQLLMGNRENALPPSTPPALAQSTQARGGGVAPATGAPAPSPWWARHPRANDIRHRMHQGLLARTNPSGLLAEQATAAGPGAPVIYRANGKTYVSYPYGE